MFEPANGHERVHGRMGRREHPGSPEEPAQSLGEPSFPPARLRLAQALGEVQTAFILGHEPQGLFATLLAVLLDLGSWAPSGQGQRSGTSAAGAVLAEQREEAAAVLAAAGWQVAVARAGDPVAQVWTALAGRPAASGAGAAR